MKNSNEIIRKFQKNKVGYTVNNKFSLKTKIFFLIKLDS